jgi:hypothetical protein
LKTRTRISTGMEIIPLKRALFRLLFHQSGTINGRVAIESNIRIKGMMLQPGKFAISVISLFAIYLIDAVFHDGFGHGAQVIRIPFIDAGAAGQNKTAPHAADFDEFAAIVLDVPRRAGNQK